MSETTASLRRKIDSAAELQSVVRTMKAMAASSVGQYENAVRSLDDYYRTVQLALATCFCQRQLAPQTLPAPLPEAGPIVAIVFGSDQGLVGQYNDVIAEFAVNTLDALPGPKMVWTVGERIQARLSDTALPLQDRFALPNSIGGITPLVGQILLKIEAHREKNQVMQVYLLHNRPEPGAVYAPAQQRLLPLDAAWQRDLAAIVWPTGNLPEVVYGGASALLAFVREYFFVSIFRACAESLASENASRLAAMQRAEKNIDESLEDLNHTFHRLRQSGIDEELFDVMSGFEALTKPPQK